MEAISTAGLLLAGGASGFSRAGAGAGPVFLAFLAIHVAAGLAAVISGALAAAAPKHHGRHTRTGAIYYWAARHRHPPVTRPGQGRIRQQAEQRCRHSGEAHGSGDSGASSGCDPPAHPRPARTRNQAERCGQHHHIARPQNT